MKLQQDREKSFAPERELFIRDTTHAKPTCSEKGLGNSENE